MFRLTHANSIVEVYAWADPWRCTADRPLVVVALGNTCDFACGVTGWYESPAWGADFVICVRSRDFNQAEYVRGCGDGESERDWTDSDSKHTQLVWMASWSAWRKKPPTIARGSFVGFQGAASLRSLLRRHCAGRLKRLLALSRTVASLGLRKHCSCAMCRFPSIGTRGQLNKWGSLSIGAMAT